MELRPELLPPSLDEAKVARLAELAARIDGASAGVWEDDLAEFNRLAGTDIPFAHFQGIYGGEEHDTWVRGVLRDKHACRIPDITRDELVEIARRTKADCTEEAENVTPYWLKMLELNIPDQQISDLFFWPGEYFGDGDNSREFTPEQIIDIALARAAGAKNA